ncbi:MAG TPA: hypothetical protein VHO48_12425 [Anaerolineaceae bacterium]|nr:hypothetical protein [Anaerolineaceae bacterium]
MNISPNEAEEALETIQKTMQKSRHSFASSGAFIFLLLTGVIWLVGFLSTQFLPGTIVPYIWVGMSLVGSAVSVLLGTRIGGRVRGPSTGAYMKRIATFWILLICFAVAAIVIAQPADGKQLTMFVVLFIMLGQMGMGLLLSFTATWWALPITALAMAGYFFFPGYFYLWMGILVGGGMILLSLYIRWRW